MWETVFEVATGIPYVDVGGKKQSDIFIHLPRTIYFPRVKEVPEGRRGEEADRAGGGGAADGAAACGGGGGGGGGRRGGGGRAGDAKDAGTLSHILLL